jgi:hypothetical protein
LPSWDDDEGKSLNDLRSLLCGYFDAAWSMWITKHMLDELTLNLDFVWPHDDDMPTTPWDAIETSPDTYFDISSLPLGVRLMKPETLTRAQVHLLIDHIIDCQSSDVRRFTFRTKDEIQGLLGVDVDSEKVRVAATHSDVNDINVDTNRIDEDFDIQSNPSAECDIPDIDMISTYDRDEDPENPPANERAEDDSTQDPEQKQDPEQEEEEEFEVKRCVHTITSWSGN